MAVVKIGSKDEITLPDDVRRALKVKGGDFLRAELVADGLLLKPVDTMNREDALDMIRTAADRVEWVGLGPEPSEDEVMEMAVEAVKELRREKREGRT